VLAHAGRILACGEVGLPYELTPELDTVGQCDFGGTIGTNITAHPKVDPVTGELLAFGYDFGPTHLRYHRIGADGRTVQTEVIDTPGPTMMHDFGVTATRVVFMDLPVVLDLDAARQEHAVPLGPLLRARLGVMPRDGGNADVRWIEIPPCYVFHPLNAHDDGERIVMDVVRHETMFATSTIGPREATLPTLDRWVIDPVGRDRDRDPPRRPPPGVPADRRAAHRTSAPVRLRRGAGRRRRLRHGRDRQAGRRRPGRARSTTSAKGRLASEAVFVPASPDAAEDEGWLLAPVYDRATDRSDVVVLDARDLTAPPVATVHLPVRIPFGFHGSWVPQP
jgi:carotenoid cleavage dioxygenase